jgi:hypothetical protein
MQAEHATSEAGLHENPGEQLLLRVRSGFVLQGISLRRWCRGNGILPSNARDCLLGAWNGPAGKVLRERLTRAALVGAGDQ